MATALITGASFGIGLELTKLSANASDDVVLVARNESRFLHQIFTRTKFMKASTTLIKSRQVELASRPQGKPSAENFRQTTTELSPIGDGEFLVKNLWMSVDPYMRGRMKTGDSYVAPSDVSRFAISS